MKKERKDEGEEEVGTINAKTNMDHEKILEIQVK